MGQLLHSSARTTEAVRRAIQDSQENIAKLAERHTLKPKMVAKCKKKDHVCNTPMALKNQHSSVLSTEEEAIIVTFRKHTLLPLDDCLSALQSTIAHTFVVASLPATSRHLSPTGGER